MASSSPKYLITPFPYLVLIVISSIKSSFLRISFTAAFSNVYSVALVSVLLKANRLSFFKEAIAFFCLSVSAVSSIFKILAGISIAIKLGFSLLSIKYS